MAPRWLVGHRWAVVDDVQVSLGAVGRFLGLLATTLSRWDEAPRRVRYAAGNAARGSAVASAATWSKQVLRRDRRGS